MRYKNTISNSLIYLGGVVSGIVLSYSYNNYHNDRNSENRYTKTHYNIIINDEEGNELLESYYIDYDNKIIYFEKNLENITIIFYTTNSKEPIYTKHNFSGDNFITDF